MADEEDKLRPTVMMEPIVMSEKRTRELDPQELSPMLFAMAALERLGPEAIHTFRVGLLVKLQQATREALRPEASGDVVARMREIVEQLARLPWEP